MGEYINRKNLQEEKESEYLKRFLSQMAQSKESTFSPFCAALKRVTEQQPKIDSSAGYEISGHRAASCKNCAGVTYERIGGSTLVTLARQT